MKIFWKLNYLLAKSFNKNPKVINLDGTEFHIIRLNTPPNFIAECRILGIHIGPLYETFNDEIKKIILYHELAHYASNINSILKSFSIKKSEYHADYWVAKRTSPQKVIKMLEELQSLENNEIIESNLKTHPSLQDRIDHIKKKFKIN